MAENSETKVTWKWLAAVLVTCVAGLFGWIANNLLSTNNTQIAELKKEVQVAKANKETLVRLQTRFESAQGTIIELQQKIRQIQASPHDNSEQVRLKTIVESLQKEIEDQKKRIRQLERRTHWILFRVAKKKRKR